VSPRAYLLRFPTEAVPRQVAEALAPLAPLSAMGPREYMIVLSYERNDIILRRVRAEWERDGIVEISSFP
jgi:hypothetical protein